MFDFSKLIREIRVMAEIYQPGSFYSSGSSFLCWLLGILLVRSDGGEGTMTPF